MKLFSFLEEIVGDDEKKKEAIQDMRILVVNSSDLAVVSYARYRFPSDHIHMHMRIDSLCREYGVIPDQTQMIRLLRFGEFFNEALWS